MPSVFIEASDSEIGLETGLLHGTSLHQTCVQQQWLLWSPLKVRRRMLSQRFDAKAFYFVIDSGLKVNEVQLTFFFRFQVFYPGQPKPVFFVASRGHHADIGGSAPGIVSFNHLQSLVCINYLPMNPWICAGVKHEGIWIILPNSGDVRVFAVNFRSFVWKMFVQGSFFFFLRRKTRTGDITFTSSVSSIILAVTRESLGRAVFSSLACLKWFAFAVVSLTTVSDWFTRATF